MKSETHIIILNEAAHEDLELDKTKTKGSSITDGTISQKRVQHIDHYIRATSSSSVVQNMAFGHILALDTLNPGFSLA